MDCLSSHLINQNGPPKGCLPELGLGPGAEPGSNQLTSPVPSGCAILPWLHACHVTAFPGRAGESSMEHRPRPVRHARFPPQTSGRSPSIKSSSRPRPKKSALAAGSTRPRPRTRSVPAAPTSWGSSSASRGRGRLLPARPGKTAAGRADSLQAREGT